MFLFAEKRKSPAAASEKNNITQLLFPSKYYPSAVQIIPLITIKKTIPTPLQQQNAIVQRKKHSQKVMMINCDKPTVLSRSRARGGHVGWPLTANSLKPIYGDREQRLISQSR